MSCWYKNSTNDLIIVSSRVRLARNIENLPFPSILDKNGLTRLNESVKNALSDYSCSNAGKLNYIDMNSVPQNEIAAMVERHVISPDFAQNYVDRSLMLSSDESVSIMIGEEDHIRIQVLKSGANIDSCFSEANDIDNKLSDNLKIAFDDKLGYLTECPTNLGIGMRASFMLHLPALEMSGQINKIAEAVGKIGLTIRGIYGEGSSSKASLYQLSNQITLGITEQNAIENLKSIALQIENKEKEMRNSIPKIKLEDLCFRAKGILENSKILTSDEMMLLLSQIKLGISMGILNYKPELPIRLIIEGQPNMLIKRFGYMEPNERDIKRAEFISNSMKEV